MNTTQTLLAAGALSALMLSATPAQAQEGRPRPLTITDVSGAVGIQQDLPCGSTLDVTTPIEKGGMEMTWLQMKDGEVLFDLTRLSMFLGAFHADATCKDVRGSVDFKEIGIQLASAVRFASEGDIESGLFRFKIPREQFLIYESILDSLTEKQPETSYQRPSEDVEGLIDLRHQTVQLHVVLTTELRFRAGCERDRCVIDETLKGTSTADVRGGTSPAKR
jgi:hypothetical protein